MAKGGSEPDAGPHSCCSFLQRIAILANGAPHTVGGAYVQMLWLFRIVLERLAPVAQLR
jgi:hypothetical protein